MVFGIKEQGCDRHLVYFGGQDNEVQVTASGSKIYQANFPRFGSQWSPLSAEHLSWTDFTAHVIEITVENEILEYWGREDSNDRDGWAQVRLDISTNAGLTVIDDQWYLPEKFSTRSSAFNLDIPVQGTMRNLWSRLLDKDCVQNDRCIEGLSEPNTEILKFIQSSGFFPSKMNLSFSALNPIVERQNYGISSGELDRQPRRSSELYYDFDLPLFLEYVPLTSIRVGEDQQRLWSHGYRVWTQTDNIRNRRQSLSVLAGVLIGFGLALAIEAIGLLLWRIENVVKGVFKK